MRWRALALCLVAACEKRARDPDKSAPLVVRAPAPTLPALIDAAIPDPGLDAAQGAAALDLALPGPRDQASILATVRRANRRVRACFEARLKTDPNAGGKLVVHFSIAPDGSVTQADATGLDPQLAQCVVEVVRMLRFPFDNDTTQVNFPFIFRAAP